MWDSPPHVERALVQKLGPQLMFERAPLPGPTMEAQFHLGDDQRYFSRALEYHPAKFVFSISCLKYVQSKQACL